MRVLDLFSGIGGFSLGLERAGMETVAFCEFDKKAQLVLKKHWPDVPIYDDVRELNGEKIREEIGAVQIICGGFPCQPFSFAGKRKGDQDDRHLWPEYFRLIQEIRPRWVIGENVTGLINLGLDQVLSDLESEDYSCQTLVIPACAVNAPHRRDRIWIIGRKRDAGNSKHDGFVTESELRGNDEASDNRSEKKQKTSGQPTRTDRSSDVPSLRRGECESERQDVADSEPSRSSSQSIGNIGSVGEESGKEKGGGNQSSVRTATRSPARSKDVPHSKSKRTQGGIFEQVENSESGSDGNAQPLADSECNSEGSAHRSNRRASSTGRQKQSVGKRNQVGGDLGNGSQDVADSECKRQSGQGKPIRPDSTKTDKVGEASGLNNGGERSNTNWDIESCMGREIDGVSVRVDGSINAWAEGWEDGVPRVAHGIPNRVDRLKQLGNAVVPQIVEQIGRAIMEIENAGNNKSENS